MVSENKVVTQLDNSFDIVRITLLEKKEQRVCNEELQLGATKRSYQLRMGGSTCVRTRADQDKVRVRGAPLVTASSPGPAGRHRAAPGGGCGVVSSRKRGRFFPKINATSFDVIQHH